ncbi:winged helix-turn-helix domain-containing protein [Streptomyces albidoflavus]|uniref:winged helix-turn-helix domain-containing protein n=1 Tax=Streptomyces albidoflavus TaxID=1886 RepID=UPI00331BD2FA
MDELPKIRLDIAARHAWLGDKTLQLARMEFDCLVILALNVGTVVAREAFRDSVWGGIWGEGGKTLDMHIAWLRRKLNDDAYNPRYITTIRGVGFRLEDGTAELITRAPEPAPATEPTRVVLVRPGDALVFGNVGHLPEGAAATAGALRDQLRLAAVVLFQGDIDMAAIPAAALGDSRE